MKKSILTLAIIACFALLLTACSGGGGGSTSTNAVEQALTIDHFNNHTWKDGTTELVFNNKKLTVKVGGTDTAKDKTYTLTNIADGGRTGIIKSDAIGGNQEMTFNFDKTVNPTKVTLKYGGTSVTYTKQ